ncbi:MAG TPA: hypothetical protein VEB68_02790 [Croceibacterium sp.]|nr:hypothetical protein [Croceibacterium sp.]
MALAAVLAVGASASAQTPQYCAALRAQFDQADDMLAEPMTIEDGRMIAVRLADLNAAIQSFNTGSSDPNAIATAGQVNRAYYPEMERLAGIMGLRCNGAALTIPTCARYFADGAHKIMRSADPAAYAVWYVTLSLEQLPAAADSQVATIAARHELSCLAGNVCREQLRVQLERLLRDAEALALVDDAVEAGSGGSDPRAVYAEATRRAIVEQMSLGGCFDEDAPPPVVATSAAPPPRAEPVGGPVLEMDPARPPEPTPRDGSWSTVSPGLIAYTSPVTNGTFQWSELPQSIGPAGSVVTLTVSGEASGGNTWATGIQIRGSNVDLTVLNGEATGLDLPLNLGRNGSGTRTMSVRIVPQNAPVGSEAVITVGAFYGAQVKYYYKLVRAAGS